MNFKTTLVLVVLVAVGGVVFWLSPALPAWLLPQPRPTEAADAGTLSTLEQELTADRLNRIEVQHGDRRVVLERGPGSVWNLPGHWPTRKPEVEELVRLVSGLRSRFAPIPLGEPPDLEAYGLDRPAVLVTVCAGGTDYRLSLAEPPGETNRFSRPTYLRLDERPEVVRLAPGLVALLDRPQDYYQQRRLFPSERVAQEGDSPEKVERLVARAVAVHGPGSAYTLVRAGEDWELREPVRDRPDPDKLKAILQAVPAIWAEQFVDRPKKDLAVYGLKDPEQTLRVTQPAGATVTLLVGKPSQTKTRTVMRPAPNLGGPPMPPQREVIHEEYRFAKLADNDQVFEIKADQLKELFVAADSLRDATLARFRTEDARRVEVTQGGQAIVLVKDRDRWRLEKPVAADAEAGKITELLDKLAGLQARDRDILDKADPKAYGLDRPTATVKIAVEEEIPGPGSARTRKARTFTLAFGKHDTRNAKLYVRVDGWPRISAVEDSVQKLVERPALVYRGRRILDLDAGALAKIEVRRGGEAFALEQTNGTWRLAAPVRAAIDPAKANQLAGDLGRLEAVEFVALAPAADVLDRDYGLSKPALSATLTPAGGQPAQTLLVGKARPGKPDYYAKLVSGTAVFAIKQEIRATLDQDSLAYRSPQIWQVPPEAIQEVSIHRGEPAYRLERQGPGWRLAGPFQAPAPADQVRPLTEELAGPRCERYVAHVARDLAAYGLDKPYLRLSVRENAPEKARKEPVKEHVLLIGKPAGKDAKTRFAKLGDGEAIFVLGEKLVAAVDHGALDWLNRDLLTLDPAAVERLRSTGPGGPLSLERRGDTWLVHDAPAAPFPADRETVASVLGVWSHLRAERFAAYGPKVAWHAYGLDQPSAKVTVQLRPPATPGKNAKPMEHTLALGKPLPGAAGGRYARLDDGPGVAVLAPPVVHELTLGYLDFVKRSLLQLDAARVTEIRRRMGSEDLELVQRAGTWRLVRPADHPADGPTLDDLVGRLASLRAERVAAYPAGDPKAFGLDSPAAVVTLRLTGADGKAAEHVIRIGKPAGGAPDQEERFAAVDGSPAVVVLPGALATGLLAAPLQFRDRNLAHLAGVDRVALERGPRKAVFAKTEGSWKLIEPVEADAEPTDLEDFVNAAAHLRADQLVAERPADLKPYGLDRPVARWHFQVEGKEVLSLVVGGPETRGGALPDPKGPRRYARLGGGGPVFLLPAALTAQALAEYRSRTLWAPLDAAQIERLRYGDPRHPFVLEKVDQQWHVAGSPGTKVNADAVQATLDALAGLRAARYVTDAGGALKLYGLEPPQLALEIQTPTGSRTLHIGRPEGESRNRYARVPASDRAPVFVIGEADTTRIVRPLAAFTQGATRTEDDKVTR